MSASCDCDVSLWQATMGLITSLEVVQRGQGTYVVVSTIEDIMEHIFHHAIQGQVQAQFNRHHYIAYPHVGRTHAIRSVTVYQEPSTIGHQSTFTL